MSLILSIMAGGLAYEGFIEIVLPMVTLVFALLSNEKRYCYVDNFAKQSTTLAQNIIKPVEQKQGSNSRGVRQAGFMVLWTPSMPSALVEVGYLSNPAEEQILRDRQEQAKIAYGIFKGVQLYRKNYETSTMASLNK